MKVVALILVLLVSCGLAFGAETTSFTTERVRQFVESIFDMHELTKKYDSMPETLRTAGDDEEPVSNPFSAALEGMKGHAAYDEFLALIKKHGFDTPEQWAAVGNRVMRAYFVLVSEATKPQIDAAMAQALAALENSDLSADQKSAFGDMVKSMEGAATEMGQDVTEADKRAVKPAMKDIERWSEMD